MNYFPAHRTGDGALPEFNHIPGKEILSGFLSTSRSHFSVNLTRLLHNIFPHITETRYISSCLSMALARYTDQQENYDPHGQG